jgi:two-component system cell cycle sensor histidine kinase/response regulator CckA
MDDADQKQRIRVLVVDDEEPVRTFAERALRSAGYEVAAASDGYEALRVVEAQGRFDLFVIDLVMPDMCGDELARRLLQSDPDAKILYFTGYRDRLFENRTVLWRSEAVLEKPATMNELTEAVSLSLFGHVRGLEA